METSQDCDLLSLHETLKYVYIATYLVIQSSILALQFDSVVELLAAACNKGSDGYWQAAFMAKAYKNLPKFKLFLLEP